MNGVRGIPRELTFVAYRCNGLGVRCGLDTQLGKPQMVSLI